VRRLARLIPLVVIVFAAVPHCWDTAAGASEGPPPPEVVQSLADQGVLVLVDGEYVENTLDLSAWLGINRYEHAHVWHNEDGRDRTFRGGLQFYPGTWRALGCGEFAPSPEAASINEQIACGRRALASSSWAQQWPRSSRAAGLR
jgi:hypothetical protein